MRACILSIKANNNYTIGCGLLQNDIKVDPRPQYRGLFDPIGGVCLFDLAIPRDTTKTLCLHERVFFMSHIR